MADAPVADAAREAETLPEEPLSEDETCIDPGSFSKHHGFTTGAPGKRVYLAILKAMGKKGLEKTTLALLPKGDNSTKSKWLYEHLDSNAALKRRLLKYRHDAIKVWNKDRRAEQEESDEASSDDEAPAQLAVGDRVLMGGRSGVITALPENKHSAWYKLRLDGEEAERKGRRGLEFSPMGEQPAPPPRRSRREGAGQLKEEQKRCGECDACLSMVRPPPGCTCSVCQGIFQSICRKVRQAREMPPPCEKLAKANLPEIGEDEQGSAHLGDPLTREVRKLRDVVERIRDEKPPGGDIGGEAQRHAEAVLSLAVPGMASQIGYVLKSLGEDATRADLGEHVVAALKECDFFDDDEDTWDKMIGAVRDAAVAPDVEPEPPANRSIMHRRAWLRIAKALYSQQRREILALPKGSDALTDWILTRAQFAVAKRREQAAINGALADWTIGHAAALKALRENMWTPRSQGERYNNTEPFRLARNETGRTDVTDNVPRLRETGPPPPSSRKKKK